MRGAKWSTDEELAILDELNGLVLAGEIALERLQRAGNLRIRTKNAAFSSQYDLASYLYNYLSGQFENEEIELRMGNIELLYSLISRLRFTGVKEMEAVLKSVKFEKDKRNLSQQIIDQIITGNEKRYQIYQELRAGRGGLDEVHRAAIDYFIERWVSLEKLLNQITYQNAPKARGSFNINRLKRMGLLDQDTLNRIVLLRKTRNVLIHDIEIPDKDDLLRHGDEAGNLLLHIRAEISAQDKNGEG